MNEHNVGETRQGFTLRLFPNDMKDERARELLKIGKTRGRIEPSRSWRFDYWLKLDGMELPAPSHEVLDAVIRNGARLVPEAELATDEQGRLVVKMHVTLTHTRSERYEKHEAK